MTEHERALVERLVRARSDPSRAVLEGFHPLKHAVRFGANLERTCASNRERVLTLARDLAPDLLNWLKKSLTPLSEEALAAASDHPPEAGVIAIARRPEAELAATLGARGPAPLVLLEEPTHLGNLGAVIRVAAAAGATGVLTTGTSDPWHPAALRGAAGLQFAIPTLRLEGEIPALGDRPLVAIDPGGEELRPEAVPERAVLAFGSERRGLTDALLARADRRLRIPMRAGISSLNLATAVAVALYTRPWTTA